MEGTDADEFDEIDVTEQEFDQMMATSELVTIETIPRYHRQPETVEGYYTLSVSDSSALASTAGLWGSGPQWSPAYDEGAQHMTRRYPPVRE
jgi:hypothetical protein